MSLKDERSSYIYIKSFVTLYFKTSCYVIVKEKELEENNT